MSTFDEQEWEELPLDGYPGEILTVRTTTRWEHAAEARYELKGKRIKGVIMWNQPLSSSAGQRLVPQNNRYGVPS